MTTSKQYLKCTIQQAIRFEYHNDSELFITKTRQIIFFEKIRITGIITDRDDTTYIIDDGTGSITFSVSDPQFSPGQYIELFGKLINSSPRRIEYSFHNNLDNPLFEVVHMLTMSRLFYSFRQNSVTPSESSSLFNNTSQYSYIISDNSSQPDFNDQWDKVFETIRLHPNEGATYEELLKKYDGNSDNLQQILNSLLRYGNIIFKDSKYFLN